MIIVDDMSTFNDSEIKVRRVQRALQEQGVMRARELVALGVSREYLRKLLTRGIIERIGRGLYRLPDSELTAYHSLA